MSSPTPSTRLRRALRRPALIATAATLLASGALLAPSADATPAVPARPAAGLAATPADNGFTPSAPDWGTCSSTGLRKAGAECAKLEVPLDYAKPAGVKIKIAISRIVHTTKTFQGAMLVNPGGPGGSGLGLAVLKNYVPDGGGDTYDWVGFDPRGVGQSEPSISCQSDYAGYNRPRYVPASPALSDAWFKKTRAYTKACDTKYGAILNHLTTRDTVNDMESIRKALGQDQISYYGFSYGTYIGQVYGTLYPASLRRVVFDGTVDPRGVWYGDNLDQDVAFDKNINTWFGWLARYNSVYHLGGTQKKVRALFYKTEEALYKKPVKAQYGLIGGDEWTDAFLGAGYYQVTWTDLADAFSGYVNDGDVDALQQAYLDGGGYDPTVANADNGYAVYLGVQCTDTSWPQRWSRWKRDNFRVFAKAPFETWGNAWFNEPCRHWPGKARTPVAIDGSKVASLLMINETRDAATPYAGSLEVRKRFPNARLIAEPGGTTHAGSLYGNACVDDQIAAYLADGTLPDRRSGRRADSICAASPQPVPASVASASASAKAKLKAKAKEQAQRAASKDLAALRLAALPR